MRNSVQPASPARRRFLKISAATALAGLGTPTYAFEVEPDHPRVTHHDISIKGWPVAASGMRVGQLSDLHCQDSRAEARIAHAVQLMLAQKPAIVFLTGDYISSNRPSSWIVASANALAPLRNVPRGVFAVLGNHDYANGFSGQVAAALEQVGFQVLRNRAVPFPDAGDVWIVGMESRSVFAYDPIRALQEVPPDAARILLIHEPDYADEAPLGFDLQLSGHSHAGQIRIPGLPPLHCPTYGRKYPEGLQQAQNHLVYTTRGVGMMGPQARFCCPPEVTVLTIHAA
ncbi:MAG: metallophosphoesterase [Janthinobacterium lividum]